MENLGIRPGLDGAIDVTQAIKDNHDLSISIDEAQQNPIAFEEMCVSRRAKVSGVLEPVSTGHELYDGV